MGQPRISKLPPSTGGTPSMGQGATPFNTIHSHFTVEYYEVHLKRIERIQIRCGKTDGLKVNIV